MHKIFVMEGAENDVRVADIKYQQHEDSFRTGIGPVAGWYYCQCVLCEYVARSFVGIVAS